VNRTRCCHSCGARVAANSLRCTTCYVAIEAAQRAPTPLRAGLSPLAADGTPAWAAAAAVMMEALDPVHDGELAPIIHGPWAPLGGEAADSEGSYHLR
jgi:hypothetical protein